MRRVNSSAFIAASSIISRTLALQVTPGSACASLCLDSAQRDTPLGTSDIVCDDSDYFSSEGGVKFKKCEECLQTSKAVNGSESDSSRFLYNLRYASATCLFNYPEHNANSTASCDLDTACKPLQKAVETGLSSQTGAADFSYCSADDSAFHGSSIDNCVTCLQSSSSSYVANFLVALQAGCEQQPAPGVLLGLSGEIFSEQPVNITSAASNSTTLTKGGDRDGLSTAAIVGIAIGATALFVIAIILFTIYWCRQKRYDREDKTVADHTAFYSKEQGSGSYLASVTSANSRRPAPSFTTDHRAPPPSYAPPGAQGLEMDVMNNAEYYDRMEGKVRGRPLAAAAAKPKSQHRESIETFDSASHVDTAALPTHPAYIPRDRMVPSRVGSRASHHSTPSIRSEPRFTKPDPYTIQVYMNGVNDAKNAAASPPSQDPGPRVDGINRNVGINRETSLRNIQIELAGPPEVSASAPRPSISESVATLRQGRTTPIPPQGAGRATPVPLQGGRTTPIPLSSSPSQNGGSRRGTPAPAHPSVSSSISSSPSPDTDALGIMGAGAGSGPPRIPSLILPSMPRIRVPNKKPPKLVITDASPVDAITGPLAFPDSRFSTRPPPPPGQAQDRIVEQTVDRGGRSVEVPIGSGKSYLYG
ncbi:exo-alpha-sialidase neuraminidase [Diaporthe eres]|uniref:LPXTG-domain-containing protein n=1 Tax=Diaporthe vaccinii TaxID=105482 RepID=A0ABR4E6T6_9PEZI|nr:exo-alpha-sialidase neuraminidase [Diaporthe eres]